MILHLLSVGQGGGCRGWRAGEGELTNVQYKAIRNRHNESPCIIIHANKNEKN
jgi:hypothetical protein